MLRYAAALPPFATIVAGSLAVSAVTSTALSLFHPLDATGMALGWNLVTTLLIARLAALFDDKLAKAASR